MGKAMTKVKHLHKQGSRPVAIVNDGDQTDHEMPLVPGMQMAGDLRNATYTKPDGSIGKVYDDYHAGQLPDWLHAIIDHSNAPGMQSNRQVHIPGM